MKKLLPLLSLFMLAYYSGIAQTTFFQRFVSNSLINSGTDFTEMPDKSLLVSGQYGYTGTLAKLTSAGTMSWMMDYVDTAYGVKLTLHKVLPAGNGGSYLVGSTENTDGTRQHIVFLKTDANGNLVFSKAIQRSGQSYATCATLTYDNNIVMAGSDSGSLFVLKIDTTGQLLWAEKFSDPAAFSSQTPGILENSDHTISVIGTLGIAAALVHLTENGVVLWSMGYFPKNPGGQGAVVYNSGDRIFRTRNGNYIITFYEGDNSGYSGTAYSIAITDSLGNLLITKNENDNSNPMEVISEEADGSLNIADLAGYSSDGFFTFDAKYFKADNNLNMLSGRLMSEPIPFAYYPHPVFFMQECKPLSDGNFLWVGTDAQSSAGQVALKTDTLGGGTCVGKPQTYAFYTDTIYYSSAVSITAVTGATVTNSYISNGSFSMSACGCASLPVASFTFTVKGDTVFFHNTSTGASSYRWSFDDNGTDTSANPVHVYSNLVYANITLNAYNTCGSDNISHSTGTCPDSVNISIAGDKPNLCPGDTVTLTCLTPARSYTWTQNGNGTGDESPVFKASSDGVYVVRAAITNSCVPTVNDSAIVTGFAAFPLVFQSGDTLYTNDNYASYQWVKYYDDTIPGATSYYFIPDSSGQYRVLVANDSGCTGFSYYYSINVTSLQDISVGRTVVLYPNPSRGTWQLAVGNELLGSALEVYDAEGRIVFQSKISLLKSKIELEAASGVYYLRISNDKVSVVKKLVKL